LSSISIVLMGIDTIEYPSLRYPGSCCWGEPD
jgi:hypothetical protein